MRDFRVKSSTYTETGDREKQTRSKLSCKAEVSQVRQKLVINFIITIVDKSPRRRHNIDKYTQKQNFQRWCTWCVLVQTWIEVLRWDKRYLSLLAMNTNIVRHSMCKAQGWEKEIWLIICEVRRQRCVKNISLFEIVFLIEWNKALICWLVIKWMNE